jgi:hypothetical protein
VGRNGAAAGLFVSDPLLAATIFSDADEDEGHDDDVNMDREELICLRDFSLRRL